MEFTADAPVFYGLSTNSCEMSDVIHSVGHFGGNVLKIYCCILQINRQLIIKSETTFYNSFNNLYLLPPTNGNTKGDFRGVFLLILQLGGSRNQHANKLIFASRVPICGHFLTKNNGIFFKYTYVLPCSNHVHCILQREETNPLLHS